MQNLVLKNEWQGYKTGTVWGWVQVGRWGQKEKVGMNKVKVFYTYMEIEWWNLLICSKKVVKRMKGRDGGDRFDQSTLSACIETS
jgi:hypothetical protein